MPYQPPRDMLARSITLSKHSSHGGPLFYLYPSRRHACPTNYPETCWQGAWHSPNMAAMVVHCLTSTNQEDMRALSTIWRYAGKEHGSHGGPLFDLDPSRGHACPINHLEICWQGAWHSPNMAAMVVHCLTATHQEDMHALSCIWRHAGRERDTFQTWQPWWSTV